MDIEAAFISNIIRKNTIKDVIDENLPEELFLHRLDEWLFLKAFYSDHGNVPPLDYFKSKFPDFEIDPIDSETSFFIGELRKKYAHNLMTEAMKCAAPLLKSKDPFAALDVFKKVVLDIERETIESEDVNLTETVSERLDDYHKTKDKGGITGLPSLWYILDKATLGFGPGELWMIAARGSVGKTWFETILARYHWGIGYVPLLISEEMECKQIARRFDAVNAKVSHMRLRSGDLKKEEYNRFVDSLKDMSGRHPFWISGGSDHDDISVIKSKVEKYKPDAVYIDGAYFLNDENGAKTRHERLDNIFKDLKKKIAKPYGIPVIVTHQFNLEGTELDGNENTLAYGDFQKWMDGIIGMYQTDDLRLNKEMLIKLLRIREGTKVDFVATWDLENMVFDHKVKGSDDVDYDNCEDNLLDIVDL